MKITKEQYQNFLITFYGNCMRYPEWRLGQNIFNSLYQVAPNIANTLRGSELDPFYIDDRILLAVNSILPEELLEDASTILLFDYISTKQIEKDLEESTNIFLFCRNHRVDIIMSSDLMYHCYINYPENPDAYAIELDAYSALIFGIYNYLRIPNRRHETKTSD